MHTQTNTAHTPGPWHAVKGGSEIHDCITHFDSTGARLGATPNLIATVEDVSHLRFTKGGTQEANARLIAAAPDLLALAKHIEAMSDDAHLIEHPEWVEIVNEARAAIARATGEEK